jgi:hypothetical protein
MMLDPIAGPATEYYRDLTFGKKILLSGIEDPRVEQFYYDAIEASGIEPLMPWLLQDYLTFGKFVFHMLFDTTKGYWTETIPHDLDFVKIRPSFIPSFPARVDIQPTDDMIQWATSADPRDVEERRKVDPVFVKLIAGGRTIPLSPENTLHLPRKAFATDYIGTSYLTRLLPFKIYEKALIDASIAGARRRAGPLWHITVPEVYDEEEQREIIDKFFAAEEDPVGGKVLTREGVTVNPQGGGAADFWKLSDEWAFLTEAKMHALGISVAFLSGEANWNSMESILSVFLEKIKAIRHYFTQRIVMDKMIKQLARNQEFVRTSHTQLAHRYRIARPKGRELADSELIIPRLEWDKPLAPIADRDYLDLLEMLEEKGVPIPTRMWTQAAGFDVDKAKESFEPDLQLRKDLLAQKRAIAEQSQAMGFDQEGLLAPEEGLPFGEEERGLGFGEEEGGLFGEEEGGFGEEGFGGEEEVAPAAPAAPGAGEGFGASPSKGKFPLSRRIKPKMVVAGENPDLMGSLSLLPLWDENGSLFGVSKRRVAQVLHQIEKSDPDVSARRQLASKLVRRLKLDGMTERQASAVKYVAIRLGHIPMSPLPREACDVLNKYVLNKVNGVGLNRALTTELVTLSRLAGLAKRDGENHLDENYTPSSIRRVSHRTFSRLSGERGLGQDQILTGWKQ